MGRKADSSALQTAKGNPGRRPSRPKTRKGSASTGPIAPPDWMTVKDFRGGRQIWARIAPVLARLNVLTATDVDAFARYCSHMADWIRLTKKIRIEGESQTVPNVNGEPMIRIHPLMRAREIAEKRVLELEDRFGLSPSHRLAIYRDMSAMNVPIGDLFGPRSEPVPHPEPDDNDAGNDDIIGFGRRNGALDGRPN